MIFREFLAPKTGCASYLFGKGDLLGAGTDVLRVMGRPAPRPVATPA